MTKEEFEKMHLCRNCVHRGNGEYLKIHYQFCTISNTHMTCYKISKLIDIYPSDSKTTVTIKAVKKCKYYTEREA